MTLTVCFQFEQQGEPEPSRKLVTRLKVLTPVGVPAPRFIFKKHARSIRDRKNLDKRQLTVNNCTYKQCCGSKNIYSGPGSGSSFEFSEFQIRIQAKVPDPTCINQVSIIRNNTKNPLYLIKKKNLNNYLPFSIQYYCPIVHTDQNSQFYLYARILLFRIRIQAKVPDPCGSGSNLY